MLPNQINRLLELSVANTATSGAGENIRQLSEEDKKFLSAAMDSLCPDYIKLLKDCIAILEDKKDDGAPKTESSHEEKVAAFQELLNHCDHLDVARDFEKLGGYRILFNYIDKIYADSCLKEGILALDVLSMCCQLNDYCQIRAIEGNLLSRSESLLDESLGKLTSSSPPISADNVIAPLRVAFKTLSVLSAIVRGSETSISSFLHIENGKCVDEKASKSLALLVAALDVGEMKVTFDDEKHDEAERALPRRIRTKAAFLLRSLINREESAPTDLKTVSPCDTALNVAVAVGTTERLVQIVATARHGSEAADYEHVLTLLAWLSEQSTDAQGRLRSGDVTLKAQMAHRQLLDWKETAKEDDDEEMTKICDKIMCYLKQ